MSRNPITAEQIYKKNQKINIGKYLLTIPTDLIIPPFSEWATENRYYPAGSSEYPGPHDPETAPHMNEILDRLHPDDPCNQLGIMKSVQATVTTTAESAIGASIKYKLWNMLYLTADQTLAKIRSSANIDPMIDNSNLAEYMKPISTRMKRKTGDNTSYKEFAGGTKLLINSYKSIGALKSNTTGFIICDEWDEAPPELKGQGDIQGLIEGRTMGLRTFKILYISTPTQMETSRIYKIFLEGDQRFFFCPCPICGELQILELKSREIDYGLTFTTETDKSTEQKILIPETVRYICKSCKKEFRETKKQWMLLNGIWKPTARPIDRKKTSYHVSGLMSPEMFLSWERICQQFINTNFGEDILKFKDFTINYKGWPWAGTKKQIPWKDLKEKAENYCMGEVPDGEIINTPDGKLYRGVLQLYAGADVQGDRIEMQVVGFGSGMETWQIDYQVFYGNTGNLTDPCYTALDDWIYSHRYEVCGKKCKIIMCGIDASYNPKKSQRDKDFAGKANLIYDFVAPRQDRFIALTGQGDEKGATIIQEAKVGVPSCYLTKRYNIYVSSIKEIIVSRLPLTEGHGTIHFPKYQYDAAGNKIEIPDEHFKRFMSERYQEMKPGVYGWKKTHARNEQWDTYIYAYATAEFNNVSAQSNNSWNYFHKLLLDD